MAEMIRAALAAAPNGPAVPEGREPASVAAEASPATPPAPTAGEVVAEWPAGASRSYRAREACRLCANASLPLGSPEAKRLIRDARDGMPLQAVHDLLANALPLPTTTTTTRTGEP